MSGLDTRAIQANGLPKEPFPEVGYQFRIYVSEQAFDRITTRGEADSSVEVGGVMIGKVCRDKGGPYIRVETTIDALHAEEKGTELTFTHATWDHIHSEMDTRHKGQRIVGWYHTHPGFGVFLSDRDQFIHQSFFNLPYQIALVYDPKSREHGVFVWSENETKRCRRYWVGGTEHIWDGSRPSQPRPKPPSKSEKVQMKNESERPEPEPVRGLDLASYALVGLAFLIAGGALGWWLGQRSIEDLARRAEVKIAQARQEGTRDALRLVNDDLLMTLRTVLSSDGVRASLEEGLAAIDDGLSSLAVGNTSRSVAALNEGRRRLVRLRDDYVRTERILATLESGSRVSSLRTRDTLRAITEQRSAIGQLFEEIAADSTRDGDLDRAQRLLQAAIKLDPDNSRRYRRKLDEARGVLPEESDTRDTPRQEDSP